MKKFNWFNEITRCCLAAALLTLAIYIVVLTVKDAGLFKTLVVTFLVGLAWELSIKYFDYSNDRKD